MPKKRGAPLPSDLRKKLRRAVGVDGEQKTSRSIGIHPAAVARALAGLHVLPGTAAMIEKALNAKSEV